MSEDSTDTMGSQDNSHAKPHKSDTRVKINKIIECLTDGLYERETAVKKTLLASFAGESIFFLGPPGVAKSLISRRLKYLYHEATSFEYLMNRFSTPEELFGPISVSKLRDEDKLERNVENYLPSAHIAFLDEIWKAGPSIQNTLLTILNERIYRNGTQIIDVPLITIIAASNELPKRGRGLEALWDRFIVRIEVKNVEEQTSFESIITQNSIPELSLPDHLTISQSDYEEIHQEIAKIEIGSRILAVLYHLRSLLEDHNMAQSNRDNMIYVSDRRWKKVVKILRTAAYMNGRTAVDLLDILLVRDMIWDRPEHRDMITEMIKASIKKYYRNYHQAFQDLESRITELEERIGLRSPYTHHSRASQVSSLIDQYNIYHIEIAYQGDSDGASLTQIKYAYNWQDRFNQDWLPTEGDMIGLCYADLRHSETVKIISVNSSTESLVFNISLDDQPFKVIFDTNPTQDSETQESELEDIPTQLDEIKDTVNMIEQQFEAEIIDQLDSFETNLLVDSAEADIVLEQVEQIHQRLFGFGLKIEELEIKLQQTPLSASEQRLP